MMILMDHEAFLVAKTDFMSEKNLTLQIGKFTANTIIQLTTLFIHG